MFTLTILDLLALALIQALVMVGLNVVFRRYKRKMDDLHFTSLKEVLQGTFGDDAEIVIEDLDKYGKEGIKIDVDIDLDDLDTDDTDEEPRLH